MHNVNLMLIQVSFSALVANLHLARGLPYQHPFNFIKQIMKGFFFITGNKHLI